jgi:hypothetical protein
MSAEHNQHNNYKSKHFTDEGRPVMSSAACGCYMGLVAIVALPSERNLLCMIGVSLYVVHAW